MVVAESILDKTTSHGSGGLWEPYKVDGTPDEVVYIWGKSTFEHFKLLHNNAVDRQAAGVRYLSAYHLNDTNDDIHIPHWADIVADYRILKSEELNNLETLVPNGTLYPKNKKFSSGSTFQTYTVDQSYYLKYLMDRLEKLGVKFIQMKIENIDNFLETKNLNSNSGSSSGTDSDFTFNFDVVVNCCGIHGGSVTLDDTPCFPIRGQVVRVK